MEQQIESFAYDDEVVRKFVLATVLCGESWECSLALSSPFSLPTPS